MKKNIATFIILLSLSLFSLSTCVLATDLSTVDINNLSKDIAATEDTTNYIQDEVINVFSSGQKSLYITQSDVGLMAKLVYAESRGEPFEGKVGVASVVLNRVLDSNFPNSIREVIFQTNAFSCVQQNDIIAYPDQDCYDAVYSAISGNDPTHEALYFYNPAISTCSWMKQTEKDDLKTIGQHVFFKH